MHHLWLLSRSRLVRPWRLVLVVAFLVSVGAGLWAAVNCRGDTIPGSAIPLPSAEDGSDAPCAGLLLAGLTIRISAVGEVTGEDLGAERTRLLWPQGFALRKRAGSWQIHDAAGKFVAADGTLFELIGVCLIRESPYTVEIRDLKPIMPAP